jgi:hypothetical protein
VTGYGTVTTPFGQAARDRGLVAEDPASLTTALDQLAADGSDSDGDGVPDIDELVAGTNPNGEGNLSASRAPTPAYGCGAAIAPARPNRGATVAFLGLVLAALGARAVRRRARRAWSLVGLGVAALLAGCYAVSYVSTEVCSSGLMWTGDDGSPAMNPGLACLSCHAHGKGPPFALAGTVFSSSSEADLCFGAEKATVRIFGSDGRSVEMVTNEAGNFYSKLPVGLPYTAAVLVDDRASVMQTPQSSGDCNSCHQSQGANGAPGRVLAP